MKHTKTSRLLSVLLTLCMLLSILPVAAFADDTETITVTYDLNGGTPGPQFPEGGQKTIPKGKKIYIDTSYPEFVAPPEGMRENGFEMNGAYYPYGFFTTADEDMTIKFMWRPDVPEVDRVEATVLGLAEGNTPKDLSVVTPPDVHYTAKITKVTTTDSLNPQLIGPDDVFVAGTPYTVFIEFKMTDGYIAAPVVSFSVNETGGNCGIVDEKTVNTHINIIPSEEGKIQLIINPNADEGPDFPKNGYIVLDEGTVLNLTAPDPRYIITPENRTLDYYLINNVKYQIGDTYTCNTDTSILLAWKDITPPSSETVTLTYDINGGTKGPDFIETAQVEKGDVWTVYAPPESFVKAPEGQEFDALLLNGVRYEEGDSYTFNTNTTMKFLWKNEVSEVNCVDATVMGVIAGNTPKDLSVIVPLDAHYTAEIDEVYIPDTHQTLGPDDVFTAGIRYRIYVTFKTTDGYIAAPSASYSINGSGGNCSISEDKKSLRGLTHLTATAENQVFLEIQPGSAQRGPKFPQGGTVIIDKGTVLNLTAPDPDYIIPAENKELDYYLINNVKYQIGDTYTCNTDTYIMLYWKDITPPSSETVTLTYDINGGTKGSDFVETAQVEKGTEWVVSAPPESFAKAPAGKEFDAVEIKGQRYEVGKTYTYNEDTTIKLLWKDKAPETITITYDVNGGTKGPDFEETLEVTVNTSVIFASPASNMVTPPEGKEFDGYLIENHVYHPGDGYTFTHDVTIKLLWKDIRPETEMVTVTHDPNGGTKGPKFAESERVIKGFEWEVEYFGEDFVKAPEGQEFDALLIKGQRYEVGETYTFTEDTTVKFLWKDIAPAPSDEYSITVINGTANYKTAGEGAIVRLKANDRSDENLVFDGWKVLKGHVTIRNNEFLMPCEDVIIKAMYRAEEPDPDHKPDHKPDHSDKHDNDKHETDPYDISIHWTDGGKVITEDGEGSIQSYQFKPDKGYHVADVLLDDESVLDRVKDNRLTIYGANHINELKVLFAPNNKVNPSTGAYDTSSLMMAAVMTAAAAFFVSKKHK